MIVKSKIEDQHDWLFIEEIPDVYIANNPLIEKKINIKLNSYEIENFQLTTGGLFLLYSNMSFKSKKNIQIDVLGESITTQFIFSKSLNKEQTGNFRSRHNIRYIPSYQHHYELNSGSEFTYFLLVLSKNYYFQLIDRQSVLHENFVKDIEKGKYTSFGTEDYMVTPDMQRVIKDLLNCKREGELKKLHTEAKILELLMYQMEQMMENTEIEKPSFKTDDIEKIEKAKDILNARYINPPTLKELSREVFLNEFKLKKLFKEYLDITVYDYLTRVRMEHAKRLLSKNDLNVYEVANLIGFKHAPAFSNAFRKYYGVSPKEIKF